MYTVIQIANGSEIAHQVVRQADLSPMYHALTSDYDAAWALADSLNARVASNLPKEFCRRP